MEGEILDYNAKLKRPTYTILAFIFSIISLLLLVFLFAQISSTIKPMDNLYIPDKAVMAIFVATILGAIFNLIGILQKERIKYLKIFSLIVNGTLLSFIIIMTILGIFK